MKMLKWLTLGFLTLAMAGTALAGSITPGLERQMQDLKGDDIIKVLVVMADQPDISSLDWQLHDAKADLASRHATVIETLQDAQKRSQGDLLRSLDSSKASGDILGYKSHWIVNSVVVTGTVDKIRDLSRRADVERIEADLVVELIEPVESKKEVAKDGRGIGITPGVVVVGARRVWDELGIDGTGVIVGNLDTGVDGNHEALADRWQGNFADPSTAWLDVAGYGHSTPQDLGGHGSHVMGTITGLAADDTIGVAPGATWIATNVINMGAGGSFDNAVIASLEFMADPDGNPFTTQDIPAVVQNSWGVHEGFSGYYDCDSRWWSAIDNCEAAGVVLTWSAGNEGPGSETLRSPGDRAASPYNCFSVGSTVTYAPYTISGFSSRGPSGCGGEWAMKPEIVAPGSDIYSVSAGGGYTYMSGTSMAGPHLAGVVALMRASNPNLDVITVKQVLMDTAIDLGAAGEDNIYGHGMVDAYEAVLAVMGGLGVLEGYVTDYYTGEPIEGAVVRRVGGFNNDTTDENGYFSMMLPAEELDFTIEAFGFLDQSFTATIIEDGTVTVNPTMGALPSGLVSGYVYNSDGNPVTGATVSVMDTPVSDILTDANGYYQVSLPAAAGTYYDLRARAQGMGAVVQTIEVAGDVSLDFTLPDWFGEDFESGDFELNEWQMSGSSPWVIDTDAHEGQYSAASGNIGDNQNSIISMVMGVTAESDISFWFKVSSEANYDYLRFFVDGNEIESWAGEVGWTQFSYTVQPGTHNFAWEYDKDVYVTNGEDRAWLDFIEFPIASVPNISVDVTEIYEAQVGLPGGRSTVPVTISNLGEGPLTWDLDLYQVWPAIPDPASTVPYLEPIKDQADPREGTGFAAGWAGPDSYGYHWEDNDAPSGPSYEWVDITASGTMIDGDDEAVYGPFPLGMDFSFYGQNQDEIYISPNGMAAFSNFNLAYGFMNQGIPDGTQPDNMVAVMWDDLDPSQNGEIYYLADDANGRFIVTWNAVRNWATGHNCTFQMILNADGSIICQYQDIGSTESATIGIENAEGDTGLQVSFNGEYVTDGMALGFYPPAPLGWVTASPLAGATGPGSSNQVDVNFNADDLYPGHYNAELLINSNDPDTPQILIPIQLVVSYGSAVGELPTVVELQGAVPNPFNPATDIKFSLPADASVRLQVYDVSGRLVRSLLNEQMAAGQHEARWNGRDDSGRAVASGTYFARLVVSGTTSVKPMVLVR